MISADLKRKKMHFSKWNFVSFDDSHIMRTVCAATNRNEENKIEIEQTRQKANICSFFISFLWFQLHFARYNHSTLMHEQINETTISSIFCSSIFLRLSLLREPFFSVLYCECCSGVMLFLALETNEHPKTAQYWNAKIIFQSFGVVCVDI